MHHVSMTAHGRTVKFDLLLDVEGFYADYATKAFIESNGMAEPETVHLMFRVLREGDICYDAGANIGLFTLVMSRLVGPTGKVLAFEPSPNNISKLTVNLAVNRVTNVEIHEVALWNGHQELPFFMAIDSGTNSCARGDNTITETEVQACRLNEFKTTARPRLIKMDVEGAEHRALQGATDLLHRRVPYIVCELNPTALGRMGTTQRALRQFMIDNGYDTFSLHPDGSLPSLVPRGTLLNPTRENTNILFSTSRYVGEAWSVQDC